MRAYSEILKNMKSLLCVFLLLSIAFHATGQQKPHSIKSTKNTETTSIPIVEAPPYKGDVALNKTLLRINQITYDIPFKAIDICDSLLIIYPEDELIGIYKVNAISATEDKSVRVSRLIACVKNETNPTILDVIINRLQIANDLVYTEQAKVVSDKLVSLRGNATDYYLRGEIKVDLERFSDAQLDYNQALQLSYNHRNPKIVESIAFCYKAAGEYFEAIQGFNEVLGISKFKGNILYNRGICKLELQDFRGAIVDFDGAINVQNSSLTGYPYKQEILAQKARASIALKMYTSAANDLAYILNNSGSGNDKFKSEVYNLLGIARHYLKQKESACINWSKAGELGSHEAYDNIKQFCK